MSCIAREVECNVKNAVVIETVRVLLTKIPADRYIAHRVLSHRYVGDFYVCLFNTTIGLTSTGGESGEIKNEKNKYQ